MFWNFPNQACHMASCFRWRLEIVPQWGNFFRCQGESAAPLWGGASMCVVSLGRLEGTHFGPYYTQDRDSSSFPMGRSSLLTAGLATLGTGYAGKQAGKAEYAGEGEGPPGDGGSRAWRMEQQRWGIREIWVSKTMRLPGGARRSAGRLNRFVGGGITAIK